MTRYWQDIQPGEQFETGQLEISKQDILEFAAEFDPQPYHLDSDAAADSIFGGLCASGWQVAALMMRLLTDSLHRQALPIAGIAAVPTMRWKMPVFADDTLSARVTVTGREETVSTNQLDFAVPQRLGLVYRGADNAEHHPFCIHRAPASTHERMVAFLIEHFGGAFPTWLAPTQVQVLTVSDQFRAYGEDIVARLRRHFVRAVFDESSETMGKKIRNAVTRKIPNVLVVGEREQEDGTVTVRRYGSRDQVTVSLDEFEKDLLERIRTRALDRVDWASSDS